MVRNSSEFKFSKKIELSEKEVGLKDITDIMIDYKIESQRFVPNKNNPYEQKVTKRILGLYYFRDGGRRWQEFGDEKWKRMDSGKIMHDFGVSRRIGETDLEIDVVDAIMPKVPPYIRDFLREIKEYESQRR